MGNWLIVREDELYHHGILGQKWGIRRFQNPDGSLTPAGVKRQARLEAKASKKEAKAKKKAAEESRQKSITESHRTDYRNMTDDELRRVVNRKQMEQQYQSMVEKEFDKASTDQMISDVVRQQFLNLTRYSFEQLT